MTALHGVQYRNYADEAAAKPAAEEQKPAENESSMSMLKIAGIGAAVLALAGAAYLYSQGTLGSTVASITAAVTGAAKTAWAFAAANPVLVGGAVAVVLLAVVFFKWDSISAFFSSKKEEAAPAEAAKPAQEEKPAEEAAKA